MRDYLISVYEFYSEDVFFYNEIFCDDDSLGVVLNGIFASVLV